MMSNGKKKSWKDKLLETDENEASGLPRIAIIIVWGCLIFGPAGVIAGILLLSPWIFMVGALLTFAFVGILFLTAFTISMGAKAKIHMYLAEKKVEREGKQK